MCVFSCMLTKHQYKKIKLANVPRFARVKKLYINYVQKYFTYIQIEFCPKK